MNTAISSMMTAQTATAAMDASISQVEEIMRNNTISALPIIANEEGHVIGIISMRDIMHFHHDKRDPATVSAWEICSYKPLIVSPDTSISDVAKLMVGHGVHHILVAKDLHTVGIVSALDFVKRCI
ncbi:CBS domain-containing protein [Undibacterium sp.]|uniref:CBS domain-containing protein n=1 Tax=Undibacterium sp. TaxID=1914977 RepID=UPI0025F9BE7B|nr:CBS domain-containing protein [Undibacterium sp.]